jgi:hypothetical protein
VITGIQMEGQIDLPDVANADDALGGRFAPTQHRQEQGVKQGDEGYHHQQFDQGKSAMHPFGCVAQRMARAILPSWGRIRINAMQ